MLFFANLEKKFNLFKKPKDNKSVQLAIGRISILK